MSHQCKFCDFVWERDNPCEYSTDPETHETTYCGNQERQSNKNDCGHGCFQCQFCNKWGHTEIEHTVTCPIGQLWILVNTL